MPEAKAKTTPKATISAKVTRADGTVEDLGEIAGVSQDDANAAIKLLRSIANKVRKD
jgi:hypothetical protein